MRWSIVLLPLCAAWAPPRAARPRLTLRRSDPRNLSPEQMKEAAKAMSSMTPADMERMMGEIASLSPAQKEEMKKMGMNPGVVEMMAKMAKSNPGVLQQAQKMMSGMSPDQIEAATRQAQQQIESLSPDEMSRMTDQMGATMGATAPPGEVGGMPAVTVPPGLP